MKVRDNPNQKRPEPPPAQFPVTRTVSAEVLLERIRCAEVANSEGHGLMRTAKASSRHHAMICEEGALVAFRIADTILGGDDA